MRVLKPQKTQERDWNRGRPGKTQEVGYIVWKKACLFLKTKKICEGLSGILAQKLLEPACPLHAQRFIISLHPNKSCHYSYTSPMPVSFEISFWHYKNPFSLATEPTDSSSKKKPWAYQMTGELRYMLFFQLKCLKFVWITFYESTPSLTTVPSCNILHFKHFNLNYSFPNPKTFFPLHLRS